MTKSESRLDGEKGWEASQFRCDCSSKFSGMRENSFAMPPMRLLSKPTLVMRCLNSPPVLNSLEGTIVEAVPMDARHVLVVNAGDGRLARAIREKIGNGVVVSVITVQDGIERWVDDFPQRGSEPWNLEWYRRQAAAQGAFDCVIFFQLHEFWRGELHALFTVLQLAKPGALVWTSFVNAQAYRMIGRFLPPVRLGHAALGDAARTAANLDLASWLDFVGRLGGTIVQLWGLLEQNAQEYCQKQPAQPAPWEFRGIKVSIGTLADAFLWGASVAAVGFRLRGGGSDTPAPKVSFSPYSANLFQALVFPYPDFQMREVDLTTGELQIAAWRQAPPQNIGGLSRYVLEQIGGLDQPKRALFVGSGWGRDLIVLRRHCPKWEWMGFDHNRKLVALGENLLASSGALAVSGDIDAPLPFADGAFDVALSEGYMSTLYEPAARHVAKELHRVVKGGIFHLEDARGPEQSMQLKSYSLRAAYSDLGANTSVQPMLVDGAPTGMYLLKVGPTG
jgi:SAM-dependent methyltransferase